MLSERPAERAVVGRGGTVVQGQTECCAPSQRLAECIVGSDLIGSQEVTLSWWGDGVSDKLTSIYSL